MRSISEVLVVAVPLLDDEVDSLRVVGEGSLDLPRCGVVEFDVLDLIAHEPHIGLHSQSAGTLVLDDDLAIGQKLLVDLHFMDLTWRYFWKKAFPRSKSAVDL